MNEWFKVGNLEWIIEDPIITYQPYKNNIYVHEVDGLFYMFPFDLRPSASGVFVTI